MRTVAVILLLGVAGLAADWTAPPVQPVDAALDDAVLALTGRQDAFLIDLALALGQNPTNWQSYNLLDQVVVPANDADPITPLREIVRLLAAQHGAGVALEALAEQLQENLAGALASSNDAAVSFQLHAMVLAGFTGEPIADLRARLLDLQNGGWGCGPWLGPECTGFALEALGMSGGIPQHAAANARHFLSQSQDGSGYRDNLNGVSFQATAWAIRAHLALGDEVDGATITWLLESQDRDGFWHLHGQPNAWATAEVATSLAMWRAA